MHARPSIIICKYNYISRFLSEKNVIILFIKYRYKRPSHKDETLKHQKETMPRRHAIKYVYNKMKVWLFVATCKIFTTEKKHRLNEFIKV